MRYKMSSFATINDVILLTGKEYEAEQHDRIETLIDLVSDALRYEAEKVGKNIDDMIAAKPSFASVVKIVTVDVVARVMRQSQDGEPMSQESQSALGYTWSGTYAIPGGGIAGAIMRNDLKRLGLKRQQYGVMELWDENRTG